MKYTIIGCIAKYKIDNIKPYVESIKKSGFDGDKVMLCYDVEQQTIDYLQKNGWLVVVSELQEHVILQRFRDVYALLHEYETDVVIWTDVKDVVFQKDPTHWLNKNMTGNVLAFSECVIMKNEPWACINSGTTFPMEWELGIKDEISYCAGTIVGKRNSIRDLFIEIYRWSKTTANPEQLSDQAAYNVLIRLEHFKASVQFVNQNEGFITQLGVVFMRDETQQITEERPVFRDGLFYTKDGELFSIVHQYDRNEMIKRMVTDLYL
jgi:hypothetical protein